MARPSVALLLLALPICTCLQNGLGRKPPLGFNTWNYFGCDINEEVVMTAADRLVSLGLVEAGYTFLNLDDCWHTRSRAPDNSLQADPVKFPSGIKAVADAVHAKGLTFGIYSDAGFLTCAGYPGSRYHEEQDAALFASWGVDYLKYDNCFALSFDIQERYVAMRDALNKTGRPVYFSMCNWGMSSPWEWGPAVGNSWRTDGDIAANWDAILRALDNGAAGLGKYAGPGGWNDPDMLEVGVGTLTLAQQRSHFALWALVKAPLLIGANLATISSASLGILKAKEVIAINQDDLGVAGDIIFKEGPIEIWAGPLSNNERAVVLFNRHVTGLSSRIRVTWAQLGYTDKTLGSGFKAAVRDLYAEQDLGVFEDGFAADVEGHDCAVLRITPAGRESKLAALTEGEGASGAAAAVHDNTAIQSSRRTPEFSCSCSCSSPSGRDTVGRAGVAVRVQPEPPSGAFWRAVELLKCLVSSWRCSCQQAQAEQDVHLPAQHQQHHRQPEQQQQVTWRPWQDPAAVKVQAAKRAAAEASQAAAGVTATRHRRQRRAEVSWSHKHAAGGLSAA